MKNLLSVLVVCFATSFNVFAVDMSAEINAASAKVLPQVIEWRRHLHQYPELGNREFKTAEFIEKHLRRLGLEVRTKVAKTGVVGILKGGQPGATIGLRADMDGLPVTERVNLPVRFQGKERIQRTASRRDARLRTRFTRGHAAGHGGSSLGNETKSAGHSRVYFSARGRRPACR